MIDQPIPFSQAIKQFAQKGLLPTTLSSEELSGIHGEILERALFSARVTNAEFLERTREVIQSILLPVEAERPGGKSAIEGHNLSSGRSILQDYLDEISYKAEAPGSITDLSSDQRLNLIIDTQTRMATGYGQWAQGQDEAILEAWPAQELYRAEDRKEPRDWQSRWDDAGGQTFDGRMIALKDDPIWVTISEFSEPYPPFDYNSGMNIENVTREEAIGFGLMDSDTVVQPQERSFNDNFGESAQRLSPEIKGALLESIGSGYEFKRGVLTSA